MSVGSSGYVIPYSIRSNRVSKSEIPIILHTLNYLLGKEEERTGFTSKEIAFEMMKRSVIITQGRVDKIMQPVFNEANIHYRMFHSKDESTFYSIPLDKDQRVRISRLYEELIRFRQPI